MGSGEVELYIVSGYCSSGLIPACATENCNSEPLANHCVYGLKPDFIIIQINDILEASAVWKIYKEQKHDLFLSDNSVAGCLMGPTSGVAGYSQRAPPTPAVHLSQPRPLSAPLMTPLLMPGKNEQSTLEGLANISNTFLLPHVPFLFRS